MRSQIGNLDTSTKVNTFPLPLNVDDLNTSILFPSSSFSSSVPLSSSSPFSFSSFLNLQTGFAPADDSFRQYIDEMMDAKTGKPVENFLEIFSRASKPAPLYSRVSKIHEGNNTHFDNNTKCLEFFYFTKPNSEIDSNTIGNLPSTNATDKSGFLAHIKQRTCWLYNETEINVPYFEQWSDPKEEQRSLFEILLSYNKISRDDLDKAPYNYPLPDGTADFTVFPQIFTLQILIIFKYFYLYINFYFIVEC